MKIKDQRKASQKGLRYGREKEGDRDRKRERESGRKRERERKRERGGDKFYRGGKRCTGLAQQERT